MPNKRTQEKQDSTLSPSQAEALGVVKGLVAQMGYSPSLAEIAEALHITRPTARGFLLILERKGYIARKPNQYRSITVLERAA